MLLNGSKLSYNKTQAGSYTRLNSLKEVPELGVDPEKIENSPISTEVKRYENGVGDAGDLEYKFVYEENKAGSETRVLLEMGDANKPVYWEHELPDGTKYQFQATPACKISGGALNGVVELVVKMALNSDITRVDPEE